MSTSEAIVDASVSRSRWGRDTGSRMTKSPESNTSPTLKRKTVPVLVTPEESRERGSDEDREALDRARHGIRSRELARGLCQRGRHGCLCGPEGGRGDRRTDRECVDEGGIDVEEDADGGQTDENRTREERAE